jgi:putative endopeptidase
MIYKSLKNFGSCRICSYFFYILSDSLYLLPQFFLMIQKIFSLLIAGCVFISCNNNSKEKNEKPDILASNLDTTVKPSDDFFEYANDGWLKKNPIPADESGWGIGYVVNDENQQRLKTINDEAAKEGGAKGTASQMIGDFWTAAMDSAAIEKEGTKNLQPWFNSIDSIHDLYSFLKVAAGLDNIGVETIFRSDVSQDDKNSNVESFNLSQGGLGLPERDYYFKTDSSTVNIRNEYVKHIEKILELNGMDSTKANAAGLPILSFETKLAKASRKLEDLRDPYKNYNKMAIKDLSKMSSSIDWNNFLLTVGVKHIDSVIVGQPEFFTAMDATLKSTPADVLKNYLLYQLTDHFAIALPDVYGKEDFNFYKLLNGAKEQKPRWKRVISAEQGAMGELLGQLYVKKYFDDSAKQRYSKMAEGIRDAYKDRIQNLSWMSNSTKQKAFLKLAAIKKKIGFPDKWKDFSGMDISKDSYVLNMINAGKWWHNYRLNKLGKPVDKDEWGMFPQTYNAYYSPNNNEIVFPAAAFIVPGYTDAELDEALMWGYVGASYIGHEITHGFDDQGKLYDAEGNLHNWWTKNDSTEFAKRAQVIINQFNAYEPLRGYHINGKATQGENIADLGGLEIGLTAFKKTDTYKQNKTIAGLTPLQRFFLGYALSWMYETRNESLRSQIMTDVHAPEKWRVNGPMVNIAEFYTAFNVKPSDKMYVPDSLRVNIW